VEKQARLYFAFAHLLASFDGLSYLLGAKVCAFRLLSRPLSSKYYFTILFRIRQIFFLKKAKIL
jgi:hypothetical protein